VIKPERLWTLDSFRGIRECQFQRATRTTVHSLSESGCVTYPGELTAELFIRVGSIGRLSPTEVEGQLLARTLLSLDGHFYTLAQGSFAVKAQKMIDGLHANAQ
jgi:hypothetical protein